MNVLVTGSKGFIGKHICLALRLKGHNVFEFDIDNKVEELKELVTKVDWIVHLAGSMRPADKSEFYKVNSDLTTMLSNYIIETNSKPSIIFTSSIQSALNNDYGVSKLQAENTLVDLQEKTGCAVAIFRLTNAFGKWSRPNYNSVVSTFCYNISHDLPIRIDDPNRVINFIYIDDIVATFVGIIEGNKVFDRFGPNSIEPYYSVSIGQLADMIYKFRNFRTSIFVPSATDEFEKKLYATYISYFDEDDFKYPLNMHCDDRGSFTEFIRTNSYGQVSVNVSKPGITKGNHYHNTKNEKFLVVAGTCSIKFRKIGDDKIIEYVTSGEKLEVVDIPTGYTHSITNIGTTDSITIMWANELFDPNNADTYFELVEK